MAANSVYKSLFGDSPATTKAAGARDSAFQNWLNIRKQNMEQQRTDDVRMAKYNAFGNLLTSMVQPIGWAAGGGGFNNGGTGGVQTYDNRQYLDAFNRAVKATDDMRNIGTAEAEYRFKLADDDYKRQQAIDDRIATAEMNERRDALKEQAKDARQAERYRLMGELKMQELEGKLQLAEANAKYRLKYRVPGKSSTKKDKDSWFAEATKAYKTSVEQYYKLLQSGVEGLDPPKTYEDFLAEYAKTTGVQLADSTLYSGSGAASGSDRAPWVK